jgi:hypothetical protein
MSTSPTSPTSPILKTRVVILVKDYEKIMEGGNKYPMNVFSAVWNLPRKELFSYYTQFSGEAAAEEAFHITGAPDECLTNEQRYILKSNNYKGPSVSVGDVVSVDGVKFLCDSSGWVKWEGW